MFDWKHAGGRGRQFLLRLDRIGLAVLLAALASFAVRRDVVWRHDGTAWVLGADGVFLAFFLVRLAARVALDGGFWRNLVRQRFLAEVLLAAAGLRIAAGLHEMDFDGVEAARLAWASSWWTAFLIFLRAAQLVPFIERIDAYCRARSWLRRHVPLLICVSFAVVVATGTLLLHSPQAVRPGHARFGTIDAFFTATSATCVTGLVVRDTGTELSLLGQLIVLVLIQIGGVGIMSLGIFFFAGSDREIGVHEQREILASLDPRGGSTAVQAVRNVFFWTIVIELVGAIVLYFCWWDDFSSFDEAAWQSVFHSISAFCNAGFSLHSDSLTGFGDRPAILIVIGILIVAGGLGFFVLANLLEVVRSRRAGQRRRTLHTQSRLVLVTSLVLLVGGAFAMHLTESGGRTVGQSAFLSVTTRTAGFNTFDLAGVSGATLGIMMALMIVGGSPGGTAGGIKTTTIALLYLNFRAMVKGRDAPVVAGRQIRRVDLERALSLTFIAMLFVFLFTVGLLYTESGRADFRSIVFEAVSAFGTVGLSLGVTSSLSGPGRVLVAILMFLGRVGPLTLATALARVARTSRVSYPEDPIAVG